MTTHNILMSTKDLQQLANMRHACDIKRDTPCLFGVRFRIIMSSRSYPQIELTATDGRIMMQRTLAMWEDEQGNFWDTTTEEGEKLGMGTPLHPDAIGLEEGFVLPYDFLEQLHKKLYRCNVNHWKLKVYYQGAGHSQVTLSNANGAELTAHCNEEYVRMRPDTWSYCKHKHEGVAVDPMLLTRLMKAWCDDRKTYTPSVTIVEKAPNKIALCGFGHEKDPWNLEKHDKRAMIMGLHRAGD